MAIPLGIASVAICLAAQVRINYQDQDFALSGFNKFSATLDSDGVSFGGDGNPLMIDIRSSGTSLTGTTAEGKAARATNRAYFLQSATVSGNAKLIIDTSAADAYARQTQSTLPVPNVLTRTQIASDVLRYSGTAQEGRVEFPGAVTIDTTSKENANGRPGVPTSVDQELHVTGSSGNIVIALTAAGSNSLRTGELVGPVTYSGQSVTQPTTGTLETTTFQGRADNLKFDFRAEPRTLTMTGNVTLTSKGPAASGDISADTVVVTVDANLKPIKIDINGSPARTTLRQQPGGSR